MFVAPGEGAGGVKTRAADTGGRLGVVETEIPAGHGPPLHVHRQENEAFYVLSGTVDVVCGEDRYRAQAGAFVYLPRNVPHTFLGVSDEPSRVLAVMVPGGLEEAFADSEGFAEVLREHGVEVVGPPLE